MTTKREAVLLALAALFPEAERNEPLPADVPKTGLMRLFDGAPGEPDVTFSPLTYHYEHVAEIEVIVQGKAGTRDAVFDGIVSRIGTAIAADRTLGGLCDWVEPRAPAPTDLPIDGAATLKAAVIEIVLHYTSPDPLG